eukprot:9655845-Ditylum_brightwellii.AAC.1
MLQPRAQYHHIIKVDLSSYTLQIFVPLPEVFPSQGSNIIHHRDITYVPQLDSFANPEASLTQAATYVSTTGSSNGN